MRIHRPALLASILALSTLFVSSRAGADEPDRPLVEKQWYGWQTLLVDGANLGTTFVLAMATPPDSGYAPAAFLAGYTLGAPVVHWAHGNGLRGLASVGVRLATPILGAVAGQTMDGEGEKGGINLGGSVGLFGGMCLASVLDAAFLAWDERVVAPPAKAGVTVEPRASVTPHGASAALAGTF